MLVGLSGTFMLCPLGPLWVSTGPIFTVFLLCFGPYLLQRELSAMFSSQACTASVCCLQLSTPQRSDGFHTHRQLPAVAFRQGEVSCRLWTVAWGTVHTCSFGWDQRGPTYVSTACRLSPVLLHFVSPHTGLLQISVIPDFNCIDFIFISCGLIRSKVNIRFYFTLTFATRDCIMQTEGPPRDTNTVVCVFKA